MIDSSINQLSINVLPVRQPPVCAAAAAAAAAGEAAGSAATPAG